MGIKGLAEEFSEVYQSTILGPLAGNHSLLTSWGTWYPQTHSGKKLARKLVNDKRSEGSETENVRVESVVCKCPSCGTDDFVTFSRFFDY